MKRKKILFKSKNITIFEPILNKPQREFKEAEGRIQRDELGQFVKNVPSWNKGKTNYLSRNSKDLMIRAKKGKTHEEIMGEETAREWKEKVSKKMMGHPVSLETRKKLSRIHKGKRYSSRTEFKKGYKYAFGKEKTRRGIPMSHIVWCKANQIHRLPPNYLIHHLDGNIENNNIKNLQLLDRNTHLGFHSTLNHLKMKQGGF